MSKIEVDAIDKQSGSTLTLGGSGTAVTLACGATQTGFGKTGAVDFITTPKTTNFTAANGEGYFVNTAGGAVTVTLPGSPSAGNIVTISDYNGTAATHNITIGRNGSNINGAASDLVITKANSATQLVYVDSTTGWQNVSTANPADITETFVAATGGTESTCGDYKVHTFTGPGTFTVTCISSTPNNNEVSYLVVAVEIKALVVVLVVAELVVVVIENLKAVLIIIQVVHLQEEHQLKLLLKLIQLLLEAVAQEVLQDLHHHQQRLV